MIRYRDLSVEFRPSEGDSYPVYAESWLGNAKTTFRPPFPLKELGVVTSALAPALRNRPSRGVRFSGATDIDADPVALGQSMFSSLFSGSLKNLLDGCMRALEPEAEGLRIRLHLSGHDQSLAPLAQLPWELLYREEATAFLAIEDGLSIVRYLDASERHLPLPISQALHVLVVISNPSDWAPLDLVEERRRVTQTWAQCDGVEVEFLDGATLAGLEKALQSGRYQVLHYMGHGDFDETGGGVLILEDEQGLAQPVSAGALGALIRSEPSMQLVFLNACDTARGNAGGDPQAGTAEASTAMSGVADTLVAVGVPAVLAMQFPVTDEAAIVFAERFYDMLTAEHAVDAAVAGARRAIAEHGVRHGSETLEWATPVLFMRSPDGMLFDFGLIYGS